MKIAVLISGGVDSSVALRLLKEQGHDITAFYLKVWLEDELSYLGDCPWEEDLAYVRKVCEQAEVPLEVVSLQKEYFEHVVSYMVDEVKAGRTPNPDVLCNKRIKFGFFLDRIDDQFDKVATGHYAQTQEKNGVFLLKRAPDPIKDQTYFLSHLSQRQLSKILFPIGHLEKSQVRELAQHYDLPNKDRKDSQGICFLGKFKFTDFIKQYLGEKKGDILEFETGEKLGEHNGFWYYTIGQRQGMGLAGGPWYVVKKDSANNIVFASKDYYADDKKRDDFKVKNCNWLNGIRPEKNNLQVKIRHGKHLYDCVVTFVGDDAAQVKLTQNDQGLAAGQFAVFYDGDICLGAGTIS